MATKDELTSATLLDVIAELRQGRAVQEHMSLTLVKILEGQDQIVEQQRHTLERTNAHEKRIGDSHGRIKLLESRVNAHAAKLQKLEESAPRPAREG